MLASPAPAQTAKTEDLAIIKACLDKADRRVMPQEASEACVSIVARSCFGRDETDAVPARIVACFDRERLAWDDILNESYQTLMDHLLDPQRVKLRDMQRSWIHTRDLSCTFLLESSGSSMADAMIASCTNREVARRALYLLSLATDIAARKDGKRTF